MGLFNNVIDWAADKMQTYTGEKERKENVEKIKETYETYKLEVQINVDSVNESIEEFNSSITELNEFRADSMLQNIQCLGDFLGKFGNVKTIGHYAEEETAYYLEIPTRHFLDIEDYISDIDWSEIDVFIDAFFEGVIGMKKKIQKQNLSMQEKLNTLKIESEQRMLELQNIKFSVEQDKEIADLYIYCVVRIISYIENVIIPELDLVEGFFQALAIKNTVIAEQELVDISFRNSLDIIKNSQYENHYQFVRNTFLFYVIACKIYNTPVLTNLLNGNTSESDYEEIELERDVLEKQTQLVEKYLMFKGRGI